MFTALGPNAVAILLQNERQLAMFCEIKRRPLKRNSENNLRTPKFQSWPRWRGFDLSVRNGSKSRKVYRRGLKTCPPPTARPHKLFVRLKFFTRFLTASTTADRPRPNDCFRVAGVAVNHTSTGCRPTFIKRTGWTFAMTLFMMTAP